MWSLTLHSHSLFVIDVSNIEAKYRRVEEENARLLDDLEAAKSQTRRNRERVNLDLEDNENRLKQSERSLRDVETRLNQSQNENDRLHDKIQGWLGMTFINSFFMLNQEKIHTDCIAFEPSVSETINSTSKFEVSLPLLIHNVKWSS